MFCSLFLTKSLMYTVVEKTITSTSSKEDTEINVLRQEKQLQMVSQQLEALKSRREQFSTNRGMLIFVVSIYEEPLTVAS